MLQKPQKPSFLAISPKNLVTILLSFFYVKETLMKWLYKRSVKTNTVTYLDS